MHEVRRRMRKETPQRPFDDRHDFHQTCLEGRARVRDMKFDSRVGRLIARINGIRRLTNKEGRMRDGTDRRDW